MTDRDPIIIILLVACFSGTSFWPVVTAASDERTHLHRLPRPDLRFLNVLLDGTWKFGWKLVWGFDRNSVGHKQAWCR